MKQYMQRCEPGSSGRPARCPRAIRRAGRSGRVQLHHYQGRLPGLNDADLDGLACVRPRNRGVVYFVARFRQLDAKIEPDGCARHSLTNLIGKVIGSGFLKLLRRQKLVSCLGLDSVATETDLALCIGELETIDAVIGKRCIADWRWLL